MLWDTSKENSIVHCPVSNPEAHKELVDSLKSPVTLKHLQEWDAKIAQKVQEMWKWSQELKEFQAKLKIWEQDLTYREQKQQEKQQHHQSRLSKHYHAPSHSGYSRQSHHYHSHSQRKPY